MKTLCFLGLIFTYSLCANHISPACFDELLETAIAAQERSYAPYSQYHVGAALLTKSGKIYSGCNVENASYGLTNCAERTAIFKAISAGEKDIEAIVIVTKDGGTPCGACRQVLNEFNPDMHIITVDADRQIQYEGNLAELLPYSFGPLNLDVQ